VTDPVIVGGCSVLAQLKSSSTAAEVIAANRFIFAMTTPGPLTSSGRAEAGTAVHDFYNGIAADLGKQVGFIDIKTYDLGETPPRTPQTLTGLSTASSGASLPSEVAACMSYYSGVVPRPRKRGRIFLGPLKTSVVDTTPAVPRVATAFATNVISTIGTTLAATTIVTWGLLSPTDGAIYAIDAGYIDNAFDIQRRRGEDPSAKTTFTV